jgi:hypothetical protein
MWVPGDVVKVVQNLTSHCPAQPVQLPSTSTQEPIITESSIEISTKPMQLPFITTSSGTVQATQKATIAGRSKEVSPQPASPISASLKKTSPSITASLVNRGEARVDRHHASRSGTSQNPLCVDDDDDDDNLAGSATTHGPIVPTAAGQELELQQKGISSLVGSSWILDVAICEVLSAFTIATSEVLLVQPGFVDLESPCRNASKKLQGLTAAHKVLVLPLSIGNCHWVLAIADRPTKTTHIYDPLHNASNRSRVQTALTPFLANIASNADAVWQFHPHQVYSAILPNAHVRH